MGSFEDSIGAGDREPEQARMGAKSLRSVESDGIKGDDIVADKPNDDEFFHQCKEKFRTFQKEIFAGLVGDEKPSKESWKKYLELKTFIDTLGDNPKETDAAVGRLMRLQGLDDKKITVDTKQEQKESILELFGVTGSSRIVNDDN